MDVSCPVLETSNAHHDDSKTVIYVAEAKARERIRSSESDAFLSLVRGVLGMWAAVEVQRIFRGYVARKRVRVRRKRMTHTALLLQRISRGGFARRNLKLVRLLLDQPPGRRRLVMKYRYLQKGEVVVPKVAASFIIQRFARRLTAYARVQHLRDMFQFVIRCAVRIQAMVRRADARNRFVPVLQERKRMRHERLLKQYVERQVQVRRLWRVEQEEREQALERELCKRMITTGCSHREAVRAVERMRPSSAVNVPPPKPRVRHVSDREKAFAAFCNLRSIVDLGDPDLTDSSDDSIDEELLRPQHRRPVAAFTKRRGHQQQQQQQLPPPGSSAAGVPSLDPEGDAPEGWLLRAYPGTPPVPVRKLSRAASALRLARTPSEVARRILVPLDFDDGAVRREEASKRENVYGRLAHNW